MRISRSRMRQCRAPVEHHAMPHPIRQEREGAAGEQTVMDELALAARTANAAVQKRRDTQPRRSPPNISTELACGPIGPSPVAVVTWTMVPTFSSSKLPSVTALRVK